MKIEKLMDKFYDLESNVEEEVLAELHEFAKKDKVGFIEYVNSQKMGGGSYRAILYESIMDDANGWEEFLLEQINNIIEEVDAGNKDAEYELLSLFYLTNISGLDKSFYTSAIDLFKAKLNAENNQLKKAALEYILDLHFKGKLNISSHLIQRLQEQLDDENFNVRLYAFLNLKDENLLPQGFRLKFTDRLRIWLSRDYKNYMEAKSMAQKAVDLVKSDNL